MTVSEGTIPPGPPPEEEAIAAAAVTLAGQRGWRSLVLGDIAAEAGVLLAALSRHYVCRPDILDGFERMIDGRMLASAADEGESDKARDRLFDIVMERFEALQPFRDGVRRIARELPLDPASGLVLTAALPRSVAWMYAGARIPIEGPLMPIKIAGLGVLYLAVFRVWLKDDSQDLAKTMAALDRRLDRAESLLGSAFGRKKTAEASASEAPAAPDDAKLGDAEPEPPPPA